MLPSPQFADPVQQPSLARLIVWYCSQLVVDIGFGDRIGDLCGEHGIARRERDVQA